MKCPNCSFVNTDNIKTCRVCGFDLTPIDAPEPEKMANNTRTQNHVESHPESSKRRIIDDSEDKALDSAFKSIFGLDDDEEEDPLDVATIERFLQKKKPLESEKVTSETLIAGTDRDEEEEDDEEGKHYVDKDVDEDDNENINAQPFSKNKILMLFLLCAILVVLLGLKQLWPDKPWKYTSIEETTETTETTVAESTEIESTTETAFTLGDDASLKPINDFFNLLPDFINRGNLNILGLFDNSQQALDVLTSFAIIGNLEKIADATLIESEVTPDSAVYKVKTLTNRLIDGQQTQTESVWDFRVVLKNDVWVLESMAVETDGTVTEMTAETTEKSTEATTEKTTNEPPTEEKTTAEATTETVSEPLINGFKSSGSFSGGKMSSGQDVAFARYGYHDTFERLAFDLYEVNGSKPDQPVSVITEYSTNLSEDGRTIDVMINGANEAYASQMSLDLKNSPNIEEVFYRYLGNREAIEITIVLKQPSQYKVFSLESPAKLVVDIAPIE